MDFYLKFNMDTLIRYCRLLFKIQYGHHLHKLHKIKNYIHITDLKRKLEHKFNCKTLRKIYTKIEKHITEFE